jgi:soluble lytic murein transglycosylase-like protein
MDQGQRRSRDAAVDPVVWIEQIPVNETRNYVSACSATTSLAANSARRHFDARGARRIQ